MKVLQADLFRIYKGKLGLISLGCITAIIILGFIIAQHIATPEQGAFMIVFPTVTNFLPIFLPNIYMFVWGDEFYQRVINNVLITKISRLKVFTNKFILAYLCTIMVNIFIVIIIFIGSFILGYKIHLLQSLQHLIIVLIDYLAITGIAAILFTCLSKPYVAVAFFISYCIIVENLIINLISSPIPKLNDVLMLLPQNNLMSTLNESEWTKTFFITNIGMSLLYLVVFFCIGYFIFNKKEFK